MKSKIKRMLWSSMIVFIVISLFYNVLASDLRTSLNVVQKESETKYFENDQGFISKTIVDSNSENGECTIELKVSNTKKETTKSNDTEIMLVIDNSISMDYKTLEGKTRKSMILDGSKKFVNNVFNESDNVKVGIVRFAGERSLWATPIYVNTRLNSNKDEVIEGLTKVENTDVESGTNIQQALKVAEDEFSTSTGNKIIILLTDGLPNEDANKNYVTNEQMVMSNADYNLILENTKNELINAKEKGIKVISLMTGVNSNDVDREGNTITTTEDDLQAIEKVFGTQDIPTAGKFYNVNTMNVTQVIQNDITKDVQDVLNEPISNVVVKDYFPKDIMDNFEFEYVEKSNIGTVSNAIDNETNSIEWNIGTLRGNEVATLRYKLKIKNMANEQLLDKTISTNEKVVLTYKDTNSTDYTVQLLDSPKIQLSKIKEKLTASISYDPNTETTGTVKAIIKTNKKVNKVDGWELSDDGLTLTKVYFENTVETVHLVDFENMTADVEVNIHNIKNNNANNDNGEDATIAPEILPKAGVNRVIIFILLLIFGFLIIMHKKNSNYKNIK